MTAVPLAPRPFTVVGGFLGAGKTTLVNRILRESAGMRYAVLVNDFGAVNIDAGLIAAHDGQTLALTNGCICCSLSDGLVQTMLRLMADPAAFDHVIVEASGVAEPARIMDFARIDPMLAPDAVLTLVDAGTVLERLEDQRTGDVAARQIAQADLLLLNKTDLAGPGIAEVVNSRLGAINPTAPVLPCRNADLPLELLLGARPHRPSEDQHDAPRPGEIDRPARHGHRDAHAVHGVPKFHTALIRRESPVTRSTFLAWADAIPGDVLRGKGRVAIAGEGAFLWQRIGTRGTLVPAPDLGRGTEIILIGTLPICGIAPLDGIAATASG